MSRIRASISVYLIVLAIPFSWSAPPGPLTNANVGPGAPVGTLLEPDPETKALVEYVESCGRPGDQLCVAYKDIHGFFLRLVPDQSVQEQLLKTAFAAYQSVNIGDLCRALGAAGPVIKAIAVNGSEPKYYKTFTDANVCERRCSDLNDDDVELVRPVCKLLAYELQEISKKQSAESKQAVVSENKNTTNSSSVEKKPEAPAAVVVLPTANSTLAQVQPPVQNVSSSTSATEEKKPVSITPGSNPLLSEDVQPPSPGAVSSPKGSTSTMDYSNVMVPNNNEPDDNLKIPIDTKQSQPPAAGEGRIGGSLDDDQGGQIDAAEDPFNAGADDDDDADYGMEEKLPASSLANSSKQKENKVIAEGDATKETEKFPSPLAHNKKPTQVGDSFEGDLDDVERRPSKKLTEMIDDPFYEETDSNFFAYFMFFMAVCVLGYVAYHNKNKVLGLLLEGRRGSMGRGGSSAGGSRRSRGGGSSRKHTAAYQKLDSNLEEAITSTGQSRSSQIIY